MIGVDYLPAKPNLHPVDARFWSDWYNRGGVDKRLRRDLYQVIAHTEAQSLTDGQCETLMQVIVIATQYKDAEDAKPIA